ncbi:hypothetical protein ACQ4PT_059660 [Festuca glaucescens]
MILAAVVLEVDGAVVLSGMVVSHRVLALVVVLLQIGAEDSTMGISVFAISRLGNRAALLMGEMKDKIEAFRMDGVEVSVSSTVVLVSAVMDTTMEAMIQEAVAAALAAAAQKQGADGQRPPVQVVQLEGEITATSATTAIPATVPTTVVPNTVSNATDPQAKKAKKLEKQGCFRWTFRPKVDNAKMAKITVGGDAMTVPEITEQLKKIVPSENFQWEVQHFHNNVYKAKFPNKTEVQREKNFRMYKVPERDTSLIFDVWSSVEEPLYMLPEVWVQIAGVPSDVRADFLALWGLGTLLGKTKEVDVGFTRKNKITRMLIGCVNHNFIPDTMDVFIKRGFYKLDFMVEPVEVFQDATMAEAHEGFEGDKDDNAGRHSEGKERADMDMDDTARTDNQSGLNGTQETQSSAGGEKFKSNEANSKHDLNAFWVGQVDCSPKKLGNKLLVPFPKEIHTSFKVDPVLGSLQGRTDTEELSSAAGHVPSKAVSALQTAVGVSHSIAQFPGSYITDERAAAAMASHSTECNPGAGTPIGVSATAADSQSQVRVAFEAAAAHTHTQAPLADCLESEVIVGREMPRSGTAKPHAILPSVGAPMERDIAGTNT